MYLYMYTVYFLAVTVKSVLERKTAAFRLKIKRIAFCYTMVSEFYVQRWGSVVIYISSFYSLMAGTNFKCKKVPGSRS